MSDVYINHKGITYQVDLSVVDSDKTGTTWLGVVDGDTYFVETGSGGGCDVARAVELIQRDFAEAMDCAADMDAWLCELDAAALSDSGGGDRSTNAQCSKVEAAAREEWLGAVVTDLIQDLGYGPHELTSICVTARSIEVTGRGDGKVFTEALKYKMTGSK
jgi:hypothetical protein